MHSGTFRFAESGLPKFPQPKSLANRVAGPATASAVLKKYAHPYKQLLFRAVFYLQARNTVVRNTHLSNNLRSEKSFELREIGVSKCNTDSCTLPWNPG